MRVVFLGNYTVTLQISHTARAGGVATSVTPEVVVIHPSRGMFSLQKIRLTGLPRRVRIGVEYPWFTIRHLLQNLLLVGQLVTSNKQLSPVHLYTSGYSPSHRHD